MVRLVQSKQLVTSVYWWWWQLQANDRNQRMTWVHQDSLCPFVAVRRFWTLLKHQSGSPRCNCHCMDAIFKFCASETSSWAHRTLSLKQQPNITCIQQVERLFREPNQTWDQLPPTFHLIVPHILLWGSCFCSGIPSAPPPVLLLLLLRLLCHLLRTTLSHTTLSHTIFHTQLCHTPSFTYNLVTRTQLCHTLSFTHNCVSHHLSHTTLSHAIFHIQLCHAQLCHTPSFTHNFVAHTLLCHTHTHTIFHIQLCHIQLCHTPFLSYTHAHTIFHIQLCHTPSLSRTPSLYNFVTGLGDIHHYFALQAWHLATSWVGYGWIWWHAWAPLVAGAAALCVAGVALWQRPNHMTCCNRICLLCQFWFVSCFAVCSVSSRPTWCHLSPRWPGVRGDAVVCAWGQRSVSHRVWQQGLWANAPCWAHTEALASQFTSLRLSNAPPCSPPHRLGGRLSHAQLWHTQLLHTQLFYTQLSHTQLDAQLFHNFHTHNPCTHNCFTVIDHTVLTHTHTTLPHTTVFKLIDPPPPPLSFLPSPSRFNFCFYLLEEVDLCGYPVGIRSFNFIVFLLALKARPHIPPWPSIVSLRSHCRCWLHVDKVNYPKWTNFLICELVNSASYVGWSI